MLRSNPTCDPGKLVKLIGNDVKILNLDDSKLQTICQILATPKSRKIYSVLIENTLNAKEIAKLVENKENPQMPSTLYHLDKMVESEIVSFEIRCSGKKGRMLKYYRAIPNILILPSKIF